jgi:hypothetical protein
MPAIAPPERDADDCTADVGEAVAVEGAAVAALDPPDVVDGEFEEVVVLEEVVGFEEVVVVVDVVRVSAINTDGVKAQEFAEGEAELRDEYVRLSSEELILTSVDATLFQQMLTWPSACVQTSLFIHRQ